MLYFKKSVSRLLTLAIFILLSQPLPAFAQEPRFVSYIADTNIGLCIATSPDGKNVYAGGVRTIVVFQRMPNDSLRILQVLNNHHLGVEHVEHVIDLEVSPDGRHLYAVSNINQALLIFHRDTTTGVLSFSEVYHDEVFASKYGYFPAIEERFRLHIAADGKNLYWLYHDNGVLAVFSREPRTGHPKKIQTIKNNDPMLGQFRVPTAIALAPDGRHLYGIELNGKLLIFLRADYTGELKLDGAMATSIAWWPRADVFVSPLDTLVYAANFDSDVMLEFFRHPENGSLKFSQEVARAGASAVFTAPDNQFVYVLRYSGFAVLKKEPGSARLTHIQFLRTHLTGSASAAMSPDGKNIFSTNVNSPEVMTILARDEQTGSWKVSQVFKQSNVGGTDGLYETHALVVSPNGNHVYVSSFEYPSDGLGNAGISHFARNPSDGALTLSDFRARAHLDGIIMSPEGRHLYAVSFKDSSIFVFAVNPQTGSTELIHTLRDTLNGALPSGYRYSPGLLAFSIDGMQLYLNASDRLLVYTRDPHSGVLTRIQKIIVKEHGLDVAQVGLAVAPEGRHVYLSGWTWDYLKTGLFARDSLSGSLTFVRQQRFSNLKAGPVLKVAPDGRFVYSGLQADNLGANTGEVLAVFARDPASGALTLSEILRYPNYEACFDIEIAPNSRDVYALFHSIGIYDAMLAMLERDPMSGKLAARKLFYSWTDGVYGPQSPWDGALSPDGKFIYLADVHGVMTFATGRENTSRVVEAAASDSNLPKRFALHANYPNPFNPTTLIKYDLPRATEVKIVIVDMLGRVVRALVDEKQATGFHATRWDGKDEHGAHMASGVYFYRLHTPEFSHARKLMLLQ